MAIKLLGEAYPSASAICNTVSPIISHRRERGANSAQALRDYGQGLQVQGAAAIRLSRLASERLLQSSEIGNSP
ncbi:hypothetical protein SMQE30_27680 [Serratia marcescens]|nr:hypothetical protein SMQE30_27680 [Serratia marcescens]